MLQLYLSNPKVNKQSLSQLRTGDSVKVLIDQKEYVWIEVVEITNSVEKKFKGRIDVDPCVLDNLKFGDLIDFSSENIVDIL